MIKKQIFEKNKISDDSLTKLENKNEDDINQSTNQS